MNTVDAPKAPHPAIRFAAVLALIPRLDLYGLTYLLVGLNAPPWRDTKIQPRAPAR